MGQLLLNVNPLKNHMVWLQTYFTVGIKPVYVCRVLWLRIRIIVYGKLSPLNSEVYI
jgi:hypothetical protein